MIKPDDHSSRLNIEIKARTTGHTRIRTYLKDHNADFKGLDHQIDTYFSVTKGRLKIREGNVESCLVYYNRDDRPGPKQCRYHIVQFKPGAPEAARIKELLTVSLGILCVVDKKREIYFIDQVKFHLDTVDKLGTFFEIEAIDTGGIGEETLRKQCQKYLSEIGIGDKQLVSVSYSDMILEG